MSLLYNNFIAIKSCRQIILPSSVAVSIELKQRLKMYINRERKLTKIDDHNRNIFTYEKKWILSRYSVKYCNTKLSYSALVGLFIYQKFA